MGEKQLMNDTYEIDTIIDEILVLKKGETPALPKKTRGRHKKAPSPTWSLDFYNPASNRTFALISMCIKDDFSQSIEDLSLRVAAYKSVSPAIALKVLLHLKELGQLGYYDDKTLHFIKWKETEAANGLENVRN